LVISRGIQGLSNYHDLKNQLRPTWFVLITSLRRAIIRYLEYILLAGGRTQLIVCNFYRYNWTHTSVVKLTIAYIIKR